MKDVKKMRERFIRDRSPVRMGNLASDLLRLSKWIQAMHNNQAIIDLMREIAWRMEWSGNLASAELVEMQREICRWRRVWPAEQARSILAFRAVHMSNRILECSGLSGQASSEAKQTP